MLGLTEKKGQSGNVTLKEAETGGPEPPKDPEEDPKNKEDRDKKIKKGLRVRNPFRFVGDMFSRENIEQAEKLWEVKDEGEQQESKEDARPLVDGEEEQLDEEDQNTNSIADIFRNAFQNENFTTGSEDGQIDFAEQFGPKPVIGPETKQQFDQENLIQGDPSKNYRLFLEDMYKYKFALRENQLDAQGETAPNILDYDFGEVDSIQLEDFSNFDEFVDENIRAFEESKGISLTAKDSQAATIQDLKEFQEFALNMREDKQYLSKLKKYKAEYYLKQRLIDDNIKNKTLDKESIDQILKELGEQEFQGDTYD